MNFFAFCLLLRLVTILCLLSGNHVAAQIFGTPEAEQKRLAQMSADMEKIWQLKDYLLTLQRKKLADLGPLDTTPRSILAKWREEHDALTTYIELFRDMHGASVVLVNLISLSLRVDERVLPPFHASNVCIYMPGKSGLLTRRKIQGDRSVLRNWVLFGEKTLSSSEMVRVTEGLEVTDRLADAYNGLCDRAVSPDNWKK